MSSFSIPLRASDPDRTPYELTYALEHAGIQRRFEGRLALKPVIDLDNYETRALVDWVSFKVVLRARTQGLWINEKVKSALGCSVHAKSLPAQGTVSDTFELRVQEPKPKMLQSILAVLEAEWGLVGVQEVASIEISVDFRPKDGNEAARALMYGILALHHDAEYDFENPHSRPRFFHANSAGMPTHVFAATKKGGPIRDSLLVNDYDRQPLVDATYYVGPRDGPVLWRVMDKVIDRQNRSKGTREELPPSRRRTRIEVNVSAPELAEIGVRSVSDLFGYKFSGLRDRYFRFLLPTIAELRGAKLSPVAAVRRKRESLRVHKFLRTGIVGLKAMEERRMQMKWNWQPALREFTRARGIAAQPRQRAGKGKTGTYVVYAELTKRVEMAFRHLEERWSEEPK